jgi:hypothetical protein
LRSEAGIAAHFAVRASPIIAPRRSRRVMTFQAYLDNIEAKTGKSAADFSKLARKKGLLRSGTKAMQVVDWLKKDFGLGHGHAMAIYAVLKPLIPQKKR